MVKHAGPMVYFRHLAIEVNEGLGEFEHEGEHV